MLSLFRCHILADGEALSLHLAVLKFELVLALLRAGALEFGAKWVETDLEEASQTWNWHSTGCIFFAIGPTTPPGGARGHQFGPFSVWWVSE